MHISHLSKSVGIGAALLLALPTFAQTGYYNVNIDVPGVKIDAKNSAASVKVDGVGTITNTGVNIAVPGATVKAKTTASTTSNAANVSITAPGVVIKTQAGTVETLGTNNLTLAHASAQGIDHASANSVVSLQGDASAYIKTSDDVSAYNKLVVENTPQVSSVDATDQQVNVGYVQSGKMLGFIPVRMKAHVTVDASGNVQVMLPWYHFLVSSDSSSIESSVTAQLNTAKAQNQINLNASLAPVDQVRVAHVVVTTLSTDADVVAGDAQATVDVNGGNVKVNASY